MELNEQKEQENTTFDEIKEVVVEFLEDNIIPCAIALIFALTVITVAICCSGSGEKYLKMTEAEKWEKVEESSVISVPCTVDGIGTSETQTYKPSKNGEITPFGGVTYGYVLYLTDDKGNKAMFDIDSEAYTIFSAQREKNITLEYGGKKHGERLYRYQYNGAYYYLKYNSPC